VAATSLRNFAPCFETSQLRIGAPVVLLKARITSMSATNSVSPMIAIPFGALSVTPFFPLVMKCSESTVPSLVRREMKPLPSLAGGWPLMFDTNQYPDDESHFTLSGVWKPEIVLTFVAPPAPAVPAVPVVPPARMAPVSVRAADIAAVSLLAPAVP